MERLIERCCGLDVHKATVSACVRVTQRPGGELKQEVRTFAATTPELLAGATPFRWTVLGLRLSFLFAESFRS